MPWSHLEPCQKPSPTHFFLNPQNSKGRVEKGHARPACLFALHSTLSTWLDASWLFWQHSLPHSSEISSPCAHFASDKDEIVEVVVLRLHSVRTLHPGMELRTREGSLCYCASEAGCHPLLRSGREHLRSSLASVSKHLGQLIKASVFPQCTQVLMLPTLMGVCVEEKELLTGHNWNFWLDSALGLLVLNFSFLYHSIWW